MYQSFEHYSHLGAEALAIAGFLTIYRKINYVYFLHPFIMLFTVISQMCLMLFKSIRNISFCLPDIALTAIVVLRITVSDEEFKISLRLAASFAFSIWIFVNECVSYTRNTERIDLEPVRKITFSREVAYITLYKSIRCYFKYQCPDKKRADIFSERFRLNIYWLHQSFPFGDKRVLAV